MGGRVLGIAQTMVTPPAKAAAVPEAKSSLCVPPGSRRCTWTSINPRRKLGARAELVWEKSQPLIQVPNEEHHGRGGSHQQGAHTKSNSRACTVCNPRQTVLRQYLSPQRPHAPGRRTSFWEVMQSTCTFKGGAGPIWPRACKWEANQDRLKRCMGDPGR